MSALFSEAVSKTAFWLYNKFIMKNITKSIIRILSLVIIIIVIIIIIVGGVFLIPKIYDSKKKCNDNKGLSSEGDWCYMSGSGAKRIDGSNRFILYSPLVKCFSTQWECMVYYIKNP